MPKSVGRPKKEGATVKILKPRGAPRKQKPLVALPAEGVKVENHAKFGMEEPCRVILHWLAGGSDEVSCKSYSLSHGVCYLTTKTGEQLVPMVNVRKFEIVRL